MEGNDGNCIGNGNKVEDESDALGNSKFMYQNVVATMPSDRNATHYSMEHKNRGLAVIFNHEHFEVGGLRHRSGTNVDCATLTNRLEKIGFDVQVFHNLEYAELQAHVNAVANTNHTDSDCFLMVVLSHGELGILYAKDTAYKPENLWAPFTADRCPSLAGKPKVFLFQACQGDKLDGGVTLSNRTETDGYPSNTYRIPSQADFLIAYSTIPGYYSWRNTTHGSWFIQALCLELEESAFVHDLLTILTFVSRRVAIDYESNVPDSMTMHRQKQIPCVTSMLTRLIKFTKKGTNSIDSDPRIQDCKMKDKSKQGLSGLFYGKSKGNIYQVNY